MYVESFAIPRFCQTQLATFVLPKKFDGIYFRQCIKGLHILYAIVNRGQKLA